MDDLIEIAKQLGEFMGKKFDLLIAKDTKPIVNVPAPIVNVDAPIINLPAPVVTVEQNNVDMSETNSLLQKLLKKEDKPVDIKVSLKLK